MNICKQCGAELDTARKYCDAACRMKVRRAKLKGEGLSTRGRKLPPVPETVDEAEVTHRVTQEVTHRVTQRLEKAHREKMRGTLDIDPTEHPEFIKAVKNHKAKLAREHKKKVMDEVRKQALEIARMATIRGIFTKSEMKTLMMALHPDSHGPNCNCLDKMNEAMRIFKSVNIPLKMVRK